MGSEVIDKQGHAIGQELQSRKWLTERKALINTCYIKKKTLNLRGVCVCSMQNEQPITYDQQN